VKALIVTDSLAWTAEAEYASLVARAEAAAGADVTVAAPAGSSLLEVAGDFGQALELPGRCPSRSPADFVADLRFVSDLASRSRFDVAHSSRSSAHLVTALAVGRRAPLVHLRGGAAVPSAGPANRYLYRRLTSAVIASSSRVRDSVVERLRVPPERVVRILAPVDTDRFRPSPPDGGLRRELGVDPESRIILNVARLAPVKGHAVLIEAMAGVVRRLPDAVLVLVGEAWSGEPERLRRRAAGLGVERTVVFAGRRDDVPRLLPLAALCVSSSVASEENSRAVAEYMAAGRPVVATRVGVVPELVIDGETGSLVAPDDPAALAGAIVAVLSDPARAERLGARGRSVAEERFSREAFARSLNTLLRSVGGPA
jgi:glycosyltransferase involved in cell wall biosynthesis